MPDWKALVRHQPEAASLDDDIVEEIAQHAEELFASACLGGATEGEARVKVEAELTRLHELVRAARAARRRRAPLPPPAEPLPRSPLATLPRDLHYGVRLLFARPAF